MKRILLLIAFVIFSTSLLFSQSKIDSTFTIENFLKLNIDSVEVRTFKSEKDSFSVQLVHYSIINISEDSLILMAQPVHDYYRYSLTLNNKIFNQTISQIIRSNPSFHHLIAPNQSFPYRISTPLHIDFLEKSTANLGLTLPIMIDSIIYTNRGYDDKIISKKYRFHITDLGRFEYKQDLIFEGETQVVFNTVVQEPKSNRRLFKRRNKG